MTRLNKGWGRAALTLARRFGIDVDHQAAQAALARQREVDSEALEEMRLRVQGAFTPTERQKAFLDADAFEVLFGGSAGGGKSMSLVGLALQRSLLPQHTSILFRKTYAQIAGSDGLASKTMLMYPQATGEYSAGSYTWRFPVTASEVRFGHLSDGRAYLNHQGLAYQLCGFDELTQYEEAEYHFLTSRLRSVVPGVEPIMRATANPGGPGHEWVLRRWNPWLDPDNPNPAKAGEVRHFIRRGDEEVEVEPGTRYARSRTFIPSLLTDNPHLMHDDEYMSNLMSLPEKEREQLLHGNWTIRISAGMFFRRINFVTVNEVPEGRYLRVRYWDRAASEPSPLYPDPDWTVGLMLAYSVATGVFYIEDVVRFRKGPGDTMAEVIATAQRDRIRYPLCLQVLEVDPGQAGKVEQAVYAEKLRGVNVAFNAVRTNKEERAKNAAVLVGQGRVAVLDAPWRLDLMNELEDFPLGKHDDLVDALSGSVNYILQGSSGVDDYFV